MILDVFYKEFASFFLKEAILYKGLRVTFKDFESSISKWDTQLSRLHIKQGEVVSLHGDFTPSSMALLFCLIENRNIVVPFIFNRQIDASQKLDIAGVGASLFVDDAEIVTLKTPDESYVKAKNEFYSKLRFTKRPGLVLFTSGSSGEPKAVVHDFTKLLAKFTPKRRSFRTLNFLLFDHWGGLNTALHTLLNGGTIISTKDRSPEKVCELIEKHKVELLPTSPSFLNMLFLSEAHLKYDLSSLKKITYGAEPMPASTLKKALKLFPKLEFQQTYGLTELGVLRSVSKEKGSLYVKIGGVGFSTRVVDGMLEIKAETAMLGYLNAPSPFTEDGFFKTGDQVIEDGEFFKILGRKSEIINVGGLKVHPSEIESVILEMDNIKEVTVYGESNAILGNIICAKVSLLREEGEVDLLRDVQAFCTGKLDKHFIPVKVVFDDESQISERQKKVRDVV